MELERVALISVVLLGIVILATGGVTGQSDAVALTVSVVDQDGDPVAGVTVDGTWETESGETERATGTTASNGKVFLDVAEGASVELDVDDDTYIRNRPLTVENATESDVELAVSRSGTATVSVIDTRNRSQADARVTVREGARVVDRGETDSDGEYETTRLERGEYSVTVLKPGYFEATRDVTVGADTAATVEIDRGTVTLDLRVVDDHFDPPTEIEDGSVRLTSAVYDAEVTVTEGTVSLNVPVNVEYTAEVVKDEYDSPSQAIRVRESAVSANVTAQRTPALFVSPANDRVIVGETTRVTVTNAYAEPVADATVEVAGTAVGETDDRGEIVVPIEEVGSREVVATNGSVTSDPTVIEGVSADDQADGNGSDDADDADENESEATDDSAPGFGVVVAIVAILTAAGATVWRRDR